MLFASLFVALSFSSVLGNHDIVPIVGHSTEVPKPITNLHTIAQSPSTADDKVDEQTDPVVAAYIYAETLTAKAEHSRVLAIIEKKKMELEEATAKLELDAKIAEIEAKARNSSKDEIEAGIEMSASMWARVEHSRRIAVFEGKKIDFDKITADIRLEARLAEIKAAALNATCDIINNKFESAKLWAEAEHSRRIAVMEAKKIDLEKATAEIELQAKLAEIKGRSTDDNCTIPQSNIQSDKPTFVQIIQREPSIKRSVEVDKDFDVIIKDNMADIFGVDYASNSAHTTTERVSIVYATSVNQPNYDDDRDYDSNPLQRTFKNEQTPNSDDNLGVYVSNLNATCLRCLCYVVGCDYSRACQEGYCGPFYIAKLYWIDAGKPTLPYDDPERNQEAFQDCARDYNCAAKIVENYMARYGKDCNGDGVTDCFDYMMINYHGGRICHTPLEESGEGRRRLDAYRKCIL